MRILALLLFPTIALASGWVRPDATGKCPENHAITGDAGITHIVCRGGFCTVNERDSEGRLVHRFSSEPEIAGVADDGPSSRILREGDQLVSVDGSAITTADAGRRLANLTTGVPVRLVVRRGGSIVDTVVVPVSGCSMPSLTVYSKSTRVVVTKPVTPPVEFGMALDCGDCGWRDENGRRVWRASDFPRVLSVEPGGPADRAGIQADDVLLRVNDYAIIDSRAAAILDSLQPGGNVTLQIVRGSRKLNATVTARRAR